MAEDEGPVFPAAPPERIELSDGRALVRWSADRAAAAAVSINESLEHLAPWMAWASEPATEAGVAVVFAAGEELWDQRRDFGYSIVEGPDERVVGGCGLHGRLDEHGLEIGYWVHVDRIGQGLATEVEPRPHRSGVRDPRHRAGADQLRRAQRPQRPSAGEARLPFLGVSVPDGRAVRGASHADVGRWSGRDWIARRPEAAS